MGWAGPAERGLLTALRFVGGQHLETPPTDPANPAQGLREICVERINSNRAVVLTHAASSHQLQSLQAGVPVLADDDVVVHLDAEVARHVDDLFGHVDIGA